MEFVDRIEESKKLVRALNRPEPSLFVVYGRRRLGKSTLLTRLLKESDIYFMAGRQDQTQQRRLLADTIAIHYAGINNAEYHDWESLLLAMSVYMTNTDVPHTLCLDEFPYMVKSCPELPSVLQRLVDLKKLTYHIVICGSSQHMMQDMVLNSTEPLYGRARQIIRLLPLSIKYMPEAIPSLNAIETVENYAVIGGVPRYWELRKDEDSLKDMIMDMIANPIGMLYEEPERLLADDMEHTALATSILSLIGNGANRLAEIASRLGRKSTDLSNPLSRLIQLGYVRREVPFNENERNSKRSLYKLNDPLLKFYYRFVVPQQSAINRKMSEYVRQYIEDNFADYVAEEWEELCQQAVSGSILFGQRWGVASRWWGNIDKNRQAEFDVVAETTDKRSLLIGECKWMENVDARQILGDLQQRAQGFPYAKGRKVYYVLFAKNTPADEKTEQTLSPQDVIAMAEK